MISSIRICGLLGGLLAARAVAGPVVVRSPDVEVLSALQERIPSIPLGNYDLSTTHQNDVLFNMCALHPHLVIQADPAIVDSELPLEELGTLSILR
jgi:hypothetical protein